MTPIPFNAGNVYSHKQVKKMNTFSNGLTSAEAERLALLAEECGEVIQAVGKILRHGYESSNPDRPEDGDNRFQLAYELGDLSYAMKLLDDAGDLSKQVIENSFSTAEQRKARYLHHQKATQ